MKSVKEKVSNAASSGKAQVDIYKAKAEEKVWLIIVLHY